MNRKLAIILILIGIIGLIFYGIYFLRRIEKPTPNQNGGGLFPQVNQNEGYIEFTDILKKSEETNTAINETTEIKESETETFALTDYRVTAGVIDSQTVSILGENKSNLPTKKSNLNLSSESYTESIIPIANVIAFKDSAYHHYDLQTKKYQVYSDDKAYGSYYSEIISPKKIFIQLWNEGAKKINSFLGDFNFNNREIAVCNTEKELLQTKYSSKNIETAQRILFNTYRDDEALFSPGAIDDITKRNILRFQKDRSISLTGQFDALTKKNLALLCKEQFQAILDVRLLNDNSSSLGHTVFKKTVDNITDYFLQGNFIYIVTPSGKNSEISVLDTNTNSIKILSELPLRDWNIANFINNNTLLIYQNPSRFTDGFLFALNIKNDSLIPTIGAERGLSATCNTNYCFISYVSSTDSSIVNEIYNIVTGERYKLPFATLAEKCNFQAELLLCGVPKNISEDAPDSWYQGIEHFNDILTEYNPTTKNLILYENNQELDMGTISKKTINNIDYYGYIDKKTGFYYITKKILPQSKIIETQNSLNNNPPTIKN